MTELLIVSKPRGRIFKWIGGGVYKKYQSPVDKSFTAKGINLIEGTGTAVPLHAGGITYRAQRFKTQASEAGLSLKLYRVIVRLEKVGSPSGTLYVEIWSDDAGSPGSKLADVGSIDVSTIDTSFADYDFTPSTEINLDFDTYYWVVVHYNGGDDSNYVEMVRASEDTYADGYGKSKTETGSWSAEEYDYWIAIYFRYVFAFTIDFIYSGTGEKRLESTVTNGTVEDVKVEGVSVGTSLEKTDSIAQVDNYDLEFKIATETDIPRTITITTQRYLYYAKTSITLDDLDVSEAYLQEIEFGGDGGVLRVDDSPDSDIVGSANETIQFTDILVPFRKLEWISGGGEVLILGVE